MEERVKLHWHSILGNTGLFRRCFRKSLMFILSALRLFSRGDNAVTCARLLLHATEIACRKTSHNAPEADSNLDKVVFCARDEI